MASFTCRMPDPSIARFRRVVSSALASLESRRQEVNDLNVFPVADGDTGDNMAMTLRAVLEELDRIDGQGLDEVERTTLVQTLARAALMGARGNSGVILSQIVRGAAEELASRPGELVDPLLVAAAFASAADAAYDSVREPAEGTMLTVFREMAHSLTRQLAHLSADKQRLGDDVSEEQQDAILAEVLERAIADGERAVARTPEQLAVLRESGVVDAGGHGLVLILAGVVAGLRGDGAALPEVTHREPPKLTRPHHEDSRYQYCTNFIVSGTGLDDRAVLPRLEALGDSVLVVGDEATLKVHVHTDTPETAMELFEGVGKVANVDIADMRQQVAERDARLAEGRAGVATVAGRTGVIAVAAGDGMARLFGELGADVVDGGETLNPSTSELLAGIHGAEADEVLVLPSSSNVIMAAERACELSEKPARVVPATSQQASLLALVEFDPAAALDVNAARLEEALGDVATGGVAPAARDDAQGRFKRGDAVGFAEGEIVAWGGAGSTLLATIEMLATDAEIVTVIGGDGPRGGGAGEARGGPAELVVAAGGAVAVRGFAGSGEPTRAELRSAPVHWPRPSVLEVGLEALDGVGPKLAEAARAAGIATIGDLLYRFPHSHRDRQIRLLETLEPGETGTVLVTVMGNPPRPFRRGKLTMGGVKVADETGSLRATWFNQPWVSSKLDKGATILITGKRSPKGLAVQEWEMVSGAEDPDEGGEERSGSFVPVHPATEDLPPKKIREWAEQAVPLARNAIEGLPAAVQAKHRFGSVGSAIKAAHFPSSPEELEEARRRLGYEELFLHQALLTTRKASHRRARPAPRFGRPGAVVERWLADLPFAPTDDQRAAFADVDADVDSGEPMQRLLMGEVGSGKTGVAVYAML